MKQEIVKSEIEISGVVRKSTTYRKNIFKKYRFSKNIENAKLKNFEKNENKEKNEILNVRKDPHMTLVHKKKFD